MGYEPVDLESELGKTVGQAHRRAAHDAQPATPPTIMTFIGYLLQRAFEADFNGKPFGRPETSGRRYD
jgi:hypothetical protein